MGRVMNNLVCLQAKYRVDAVLTSAGGGGREDLRAVFERLVESEAARVMAAEVGLRARALRVNDFLIPQFPNSLMPAKSSTTFQTTLFLESNGML